MKRAVLFALVAASFFLGLLFGSTRISMAGFFSSPIVWSVRFPRVVMAFVAGASLSITGLSFQSVLKNPLVDPYIIGVSSGAAFGAALSMALAERMGFFWILILPFVAFSFSLLAAFLSLVFAKKAGGISVEHLVLAGVSMNMIFSAAAAFVLFFLRRSASGYAAWIFGSFSGVVLKDSYLPLSFSVFFLLFLIFHSKDLDAFSLGEDFAKVVGVESERMKLLVFVFGSFLTSSVVAAVGSIGFVGLIVPHAVRMVFGPSHRSGVVLSFFAGGSFLVLVDLLSRVVAPPVEIPVGIMTSFIGIPIFLFLLRRGGGA